MPGTRELFFFFFNDTATTEIYTLSLHDALPISECAHGPRAGVSTGPKEIERWVASPLSILGSGPEPRGYNYNGASRDRKSTRLNSSHGYISYAVFCLKKKKTHTSPSAKSTTTHI